MNLQTPFQGFYPITQRFGETITDPKGHTGIDFALPTGTPVIASADGTIRQIQHKTKGYGIAVLISHPNQYETLYAHLHSLNVEVGQIVKAGDPIGKSGSSGNSTGPHLHFEVRQAGKAINPAPLLSNKSSQLWQVTCPILNLRTGPGLAYPVCDLATQDEQFAEINRSETIWVEVRSGVWAAAKYQGTDLMTTINPAKSA